MQARTDFTSTWLSALSRKCRSRFRFRRMKIRRSRTVHDVDWIDGLGGQTWPVPGCHVGVTGWDLDAFQPTDEAVNCERCKRNAQARAASPRDLVPPGQLALDLDGV